MNGRNSYTIPIMTAVGVYIKPSGSLVIRSHCSTESRNPPPRRIMIQA